MNLLHTWIQIHLLIRVKLILTILVYYIVLIMEVGLDLFTIIVIYCRYNVHMSGLLRAGKNLSINGMSSV